MPKTDAERRRINVRTRTGSAKTIETLMKNVIREMPDLGEMDEGTLRSLLTTAHRIGHAKGSKDALGW